MNVLPGSGTAETPATATANLHAALLMLASTLSFGLMAITIRYASRTLPTLEVAFFRNAFGLLALLPVLFGHARTLPRTGQLPRYLLSRLQLGTMALTVIETHGVTAVALSLGQRHHGGRIQAAGK